MKNITNKIYKGFFSNVGGSLSNIKKLLAPVFELNNSDRKKIPNRKVIYDILTKLPEKFGFDIYKYNSDQTEVIRSVKITKEGDDSFLIGFNDKDARSIIRSITYQYPAHYNTEDVSRCVHSFYLIELPLKVVMTYNGEEVK